MDRPRCGISTCMSNPLLTASSSLVACDEQRAVYIESTNAMDTLVILDRAKRTRTPLATPFTQFSQLRMAGDELVCIASSSRTVPAIVAVSLRNGSTRILQTCGTVNVPPELISEPEPLIFPTQCPDGTPASAHALLYPPRNPEYKAPHGTLPPCRIIAHSGPTSRVSSTLDLGIQYWTSRGWLGAFANLRS